MEYAEDIVDEHSQLCLLIPKVEAIVGPISDVGHARLARLAEQHTRFYTQVTGWDGERAATRAHMDAASVTGCFPLIERDDIVLAMQAWFAFLCVFDDEVEKLEALQAQRVLEEGIVILSSPGMPAAKERSRSLVPDETSSVVAMVTAYKAYQIQLAPDTFRWIPDLLQASAQVLRGMRTEFEYRLRGWVGEGEYLAVPPCTLR